MTNIGRLQTFTGLNLPQRPMVFWKLQVKVPILSIISPSHPTSPGSIWHKVRSKEAKIGLSVLNISPCSGLMLLGPEANGCKDLDHDVDLSAQWCSEDSRNSSKPMMPFIWDLSIFIVQTLFILFYVTRHAPCSPCSSYICWLKR